MSPERAICWGLERKSEDLDRWKESLVRDDGAYFDPAFILSVQSFFRT